jgi:hypothetical protein
MRQAIGGGRRLGDFGDAPPELTVSMPQQRAIKHHPKCKLLSPAAIFYFLHISK